MFPVEILVLTSSTSNWTQGSRVQLLVQGGPYRRPAMKYIDGIKIEFSRPVDGLYWIRTCRMYISHAFECYLYMGLIARKPLFRVSNKVRFKPACLATETGLNIKIVHAASEAIILYHTASEAKIIWLKLQLLSYPSVLTCFLDAKKNRLIEMVLIEMVLLSTHNICFG